MKAVKRVLPVALAVFAQEIYAEGAREEEAVSSTTLETVTVTAKEEKSPLTIYNPVITKEKIEHSPSGNGDIGSMLKSLPNVQFDKTQNSGKTPGEIAPAQISISGGQPYQNAFLVDGVSINNDIDPAGGGSWLGRPPGRSQGVALDVSLFEKITVHDANVPAAYGGFSGGVVETKTRRPEKDFGFKISHQYTNGNIDKSFPGSLTRYHLHGTEEEMEEFRNSYDKSNQPVFSKHITRASFESILNDRWGIIGSFVRSQSIIPLRRSEDSYASEKGNSQATPIDPANSATAKQNQERFIYNYFIKTYYDPTPDLGFELSYTYSPDYGREFLVGTQGNYFDFEHGGHQLGFTTNYNNQLGKLTNTLSYSSLADKTVAHGYDAIRYWQASDSKKWSNWATWVREGGWAPGESYQTTWSNKLVQEFKPFAWGNTTHRVSAGVELTHERADFSYTRDFFAAIKTSTFMSKEQREMCLQTDFAWCDPAPAYDPRGFEEIDGTNVVAYNWISPLSNKPRRIGKWQYGQYFKSVYLYRKGKVSVTNEQLGAFLEDEVAIPSQQYGELRVRPGIRFDYNSYMDKSTWAPRFAVDYGFPWNQGKPQYATHLTGGVNRYYGRNIYALALNDGIQSLNTDIYRKDPNRTWQSVLDEGRICVPYQRERDPVTKKWKYYHFKNGVKVEGRDTDCIEENTNSTRFSQLKVPYVDEFMVGANQNIGPVNIAIKYIHRDGRDEVVMSRRDYLGLSKEKNYTDNYYVYTNQGRSKTNVYALNIESTRPLMWGRVRNNFSLAFDWTNVKRNKGNYAAVMNDKELANEWVMWDDSLIRWNERPADNFVKPYTLKLNTHHEWDMRGGLWYWNNLFSFRAGYQANATRSSWAKKGSEVGVPYQNEVSVYKVVNLPSSFTWDIRLGSEYKVHKNNKLFFNIDVYNVLNKKNVGLASISTSSGDLTPTYEVGRQFWLEIGYRL